MNRMWPRSFLLVWAIGAILLSSHGTSLAQAKASTTIQRNPGGSTRISISVTVGGQLIKDVHLCVAKTDKDQLAVNGDPINKHYSSPAGARPPAPGALAPAPTPKLPAGWKYDGVIENKQGDGTSLWCATWTNPDAALGADFVFVVDYDGDKGDVKKATARANLFLTSAGKTTYAAEDILNGEGKKGEKGHMPEKPL